MSDGIVEREGEALERIFNDAKGDHSPELSWFSMAVDHETEERQFVLESTHYIDGDGLAALREHGYTVQYVECYEFDGEMIAQIQVLVTGEVPETDNIETEELIDD